MAKKKILTSQFSGKTWNDYRVVALPIKDLWASVPKADVHKGKPFYSRLAEDIAENGLHYPLLVVHATRRELIARMKTCEDTFCELPFDESKGNLNIRLYVIWGGSNRVRVAEELGFTHVDCVIVESFDTAVALQRSHRKPYTEKYYIPPRPASFEVSPSELTLENSPASASRDALWKNSLPALLEALKTPDAQAIDWINFGICKEALGDHLQAARAFIKAHELDPDKLSIFAYILRNLYLARDFDLLVDYLTYCKHFSPKFTVAFSKEPFFAELFAHEPFKTLADPKHTLPPAEIYDLTKLEQKSNDIEINESTLSALENAVKLDPKNEEALLDYGLGLKAMERYSEAADIFIKAQGMNPQNADIYPLVFLSLFRSGKRDVLLNFASYCVELSPEIIISIAQDPIFSELFVQEEFKELFDISSQLRREQSKLLDSIEPKSKPIPSRSKVMQEYGNLLKDESLLPILKDAVEKNPADEIAWFNYGTSLQALESYQEAAEAFFKVQELNPNNNAVYPAIFDCLYCMGNYELLLEFSQYCNQISPNIINSIAQNNDFGRLFERPDFKQLLSQNSTHSPEYAHENRNQDSISSVSVNTARAKNSSSNSGLENGCNDQLIQQYVDLLKDESLLPILKDAVEKNPDDEIAWFNYGSSLKALERYEEAADAFLKVQAIRPDNENIYPIIFRCLDRAGKDDVIFEFATYCNLLSPDILPLIRKDESLSTLFDREEFRQLFSPHPENSEVNAGQIAGFAEDPQISALEKEIKANPDSESAWFDYGIRLEGLKQYNEAAEAFMKVQELNPQNYAVYPMIFRLFFHMGNMDKLLSFACYCAELDLKIFAEIAQDPAYTELFKLPEFHRLLSLNASGINKINNRKDPVSKAKTGSGEVQNLMQEYESLLKNESIPPILNKNMDSKLQVKTAQLKKSHSGNIVRNKQLQPRLAYFSKCKSTFESGTGLEIGGASRIFSPQGIIPIYPVASKIDNCNFSSQTIWEGNVSAGNTFIFDQRKKAGHQYIAEASNLTCIDDATYDYLLSSHCIEHLVNPLKGLKEWVRVLKPNGLLVLIIPHKDGTFDHQRPVTTLEHLIQDLENQVDENDLTHLDEILKLHDLSKDPGAGTFNAFQQRSKCNVENRCLHHHVFDTRLAVEVVNYMRLQILDVELFHPYHIAIIAKKGGKNQPIDNGRFRDIEGVPCWSSPFPSDQVNHHNKKQNKMPHWKTIPRHNGIQIELKAADAQ